MSVYRDVDVQVEGGEKTALEDALDAAMAQSDLIG